VCAVSRASRILENKESIECAASEATVRAEYPTNIDDPRMNTHLKQDHAGVEVELDPESMPVIVDALTASELTIVGWYRSHPVFATQPSLRDIKNQVNYQMMFNDGGSAQAAPFVGAIVVLPFVCAAV